jgi:hypothetical protein
MKLLLFPNGACAARAWSHGRRLLALGVLLAVGAWAAEWVPGQWVFVPTPTWIYEWIPEHWTEPVVIPEHTETTWVEGHNEDVWVDGYTDNVWVDGYWDEYWVDGYTETVWVDAFESVVWVDGHWVDEWVDGHEETQWVEGYWDDDGNWQEGHEETVWVDGHWNSYWVDGQWETTVVDGHWEDVTVDGYLHSEWIEGYWEPVTVDGHWDTIWVEGHDEIVTIPEQTIPPQLIPGYWGWTLYDGYQVWEEAHWEGPWTWVAFDEVGDWYPTSAWSPDPSTQPAGVGFTQYCSAARDHRVGERNEAGEERNVSVYAESKPQPLSQPAIGTGTTTPSTPVVAGGSAAGTVGAGFSYQISATNSPTSYGAVGLPGGLTLNSASGLIDGVPTQSGTSSVTLSATNATGTGSATLTITIAGGGGGVPVVASGSASGIVGVPFSYQIVATNEPTTYTAVGLPSGLLVNATSGQIAGTPSQSGAYVIPLGASNAGGISSAPASLSLTIEAAAGGGGGGGGGTSTYTLTVVNGTGGATGLVPGAVRTIAATVPAGTLFTGWEISGPGTIPVSRLGVVRNLTMGAGNVTATATYQFPGSQPIWFDVDDDGIKDEVVTRGVGGFNYAISDIWTTYEYESDNWDVFMDWRDLYWPGGFSIDSFPNLWLNYRPAVVTSATTWISAAGQFDAEVGEQYRIMGWNRSGYWGDYANFVLQEGDNLQPTVYLPSFPAEQFLDFQFVRARIGLPPTGVQMNLPGGVGSIKIAAGTGGTSGKVTFPGLGGPEVGVTNSSAILSLPGAGSITVSGGSVSGGITLPGGYELSGVVNGNVTLSGMPGGASITAGPGGTSLSIPNGPTITISGTGAISMSVPAGASAVLADAVNALGNLLGVGPVGSVRAAVALRAPPSPIIWESAAGINLGSLPPGVYDVGVTSDERLTPAANNVIWIVVNVMPPPPKILLLLHGMNSRTQTWDAFVNAVFGASSTDIRDGIIQGPAPTPNSRGVRCYRMQFGAYDLVTPLRIGLENVTPANSPGYTNYPVRCGDFETFAQLAQEVDDVIASLLGAHPNAQIVLIGHSRGGLAARAFLQTAGTNPRKSAVIGLLTTSSPHRGSRMGRIYGWLNTHPRGFPGAADDWEVVDFLISETAYITGIPVGPKDPLDVRRPIILDVADNSMAIANLNAVGSIQNLPAKVRYGEIVYDLARYGLLALTPIRYSVFDIPGENNLFDQLSPAATTFLCDGLAPDAPQFRGDGLIPAAGQSFTQLTGFTGVAIPPLVVTDREVVHTGAPQQSADILARLRVLNPDWWP